MVKNTEEIITLHNHLARKNLDKEGGLLPPYSPKTSCIYVQIKHVLKSVIKQNMVFEPNTIYLL